MGRREHALEIELPVRAGLPPHRRVLRGNLTLPEQVERPPVVTLVPGYLASANWAFLPRLTAELRGRGLATLALTLSGSGFAEDAGQVTERIAFEHNTYAQELEDLAAASEWLSKRSEVDGSRQGIFGHSRGSAMALLHAAETGRFQALCTWSTVGSVGRYDPDRIELWRREGRLPVQTAGGQRFELAPDLLEDFTKNAAKYDLERAADRFAGTVLLVHGSRDRSVPVQEAREVVGRFGDRGSLVEIEATGHNFGARHPGREPGPALARALEVTSQYFARELLSEPG